MPKPTHAYLKCKEKGIIIQLLERHVKAAVCRSTTGCLQNAEGAGCETRQDRGREY